MKRQYIIPKLKTIEVESNELIADSPTLPTGGDQGHDNQWSREERHFGSEEGSTGRRGLWDNEW